MKNFKYVFLLALFLAGCRGPEYKYTSYQQKVGDWVGTDAKFLYARWGKPQQVVSRGTDTLIVTYYQTSNYKPENNMINKSVRDLYQEVMDMIYQEQARAPEKYECKTVFVVRNGVVVDYEFSGDGCY